MPDIEGKYTVNDSFPGRESYWQSHAVSAFSVDEAHPTATPIPAQPASMANHYLVPTIGGF